MIRLLNKYRGVLLRFQSLYNMYTVSQQALALLSLLQHLLFLLLSTNLHN